VSDRVEIWDGDGQPAGDVHLSRDGPYGDRLKIRIAAAPEKGAANKTLLDFLAQRLGLTKNSLRLKSGSRDRTKVVEIISLEPQIRERLLSLWPPSSVSRPDCPKRPG